MSLLMLYSYSRESVLQQFVLFWDRSKHEKAWSAVATLCKVKATQGWRFGVAVNMSLNCCLLKGPPTHSVWKSSKKSHSTLRAKRATFTFWVDKSWLKIPKLVNFGEFLKTWILRSNSVTRQVTFKRTKIGGKCQNWKVQMRHF